MSTYGEYEPTGLIAPNPLGGEVRRARRGGGGDGGSGKSIASGADDEEEKFVIKTLTDVGLPPDAARRRVQTFLGQARLQKETAGAGGNGWAPIFLSGEDGRNGAFYVTLFYPRSLQWLIDSPKRLGPRETKNIALGILAALNHLNRAHGNLRPTNILLDNPADLSATRVALADPAEHGNDLVADFYSLGQILYHLATGRDFKAGDWKPSNAYFWKWPYDGINGQWAKLIRRLLAEDVDADIQKLQREIQKLPFVHNPPRIVAVLLTMTVVSALAVWISVQGIARHQWTRTWTENEPWLRLITSIPPGDQPDVLKFLGLSLALGDRAEQDTQLAVKVPSKQEQRAIQQDADEIRIALETNRAAYAKLLRDDAAILPPGPPQEQLSGWADSLQGSGPPADTKILDDYWLIQQNGKIFDTLRDNRKTLASLHSHLVKLLDKESGLSDAKNVDDALGSINTWNSSYTDFADGVEIDSAIKSGKAPKLALVVDQNPRMTFAELKIAIVKEERVPPDTPRIEFAKEIYRQLGDLDVLALPLRSQKPQALAPIVALRKDVEDYLTLPWEKAYPGYFRKQQQFLDSAQKLKPIIAKEVDDLRRGSVRLSDRQLQDYWGHLSAQDQLAAIQWIKRLDDAIQNLSPIAEQQYPDLGELPRQLLEEEKQVEISKALATTTHELDGNSCQMAYGQIQTFSANLENFFAQFQRGESVDAKRWAEIKNDSLFSNAKKIAPKVFAELDSDHSELLALAAWRAVQPAPGNLPQLQDDARKAENLSKQFPKCKREFITRMQGFWVQALSGAPAHYRDVLAVYAMKSDCFVRDDADAQTLLSPTLWYNVQLAFFQRGMDSRLSDDEKIKLAHALVDAAGAAKIDASQLRDLLQHPEQPVPSEVESKPQLVDLLHYEKPKAGQPINGDVQIFYWNPASGEKNYLHFIKVTGKFGDSFVAQSEVSVGLFIKVLQNAALKNPAVWDNIISPPGRASYLPQNMSDADDDRNGPRTWVLPHAIADKPAVDELNLDKHWLKDIQQGGPLNGQFYEKTPIDLQNVQDGQDLNPEHGVDKPADEENLPVQQVSARLALYWAGLIGCRPPTIDEWNAALTKMVGADRPITKNLLRKMPVYPHLRGALWCDDLAYVKPVFVLAGVAGLDSSIFPTVAHDGDRPNPLAEDNDLTFWFTKVPGAGQTAQGSEPFYDLVGNVAEFVLKDAGALDNAPPSQSKDPAGLMKLASANLANNVCVIGGSALSASPDVDRPAPVESRYFDSPFSDVGIRLAYKAPQVSYSQQLADASRNLNYQTSSR